MHPPPASPTAARATALAALLAAGLAACGGPPVDPAHVLAEDGTARWYRGNLHTHTRWSDGADDAATVAAWYRDHGYDFLAITEHDAMPSDAEWRALVEAEGRAGRFVLIRGEEVSNLVGEASVHLNALGIDRAIARVEAERVVPAIEATAARSRSAGAAPLVQLNHPNFWFSVTAEHLMRQRGATLFEVFNAHELSENRGDGLRPPVERLWDIALAWRLDVLGLPPLYATAGDDLHALAAGPGRGGLPGRAWVDVLADAPDETSLLDALRRGRFYASTGVALRRIVASPSRLSVEVAAEPGVDYVIEFIGTRRGFDTASTPTLAPSGRALHASRRYADDIGEVFARVEGEAADYELQPDDLYVRARVTSSAALGWPGEPFQRPTAWIQPVVGPAGRRPNRPGTALPPAVSAKVHGQAHRFAPLPAPMRAALRDAGTGACSLDLLATGAGTPSTTFARADRAIFGGWLVDPAADRAPDAMTVVLDGAKDYEAAGGTTRTREDLAASYGKPGLASAGFTVDFALADVAPGTYGVVAVAHYGDRWFACPTGKSLTVE